MDIHSMQNDADYEAALATVSPWFDNEPEPGSEDEKRFEHLVAQIEAYEARHFPILPPHPADAIEFRAEQQPESRLHNS
jgi:HTH-type transcriptional regulator/antitoxin HigA